MFESSLRVLSRIFGKPHGWERVIRCFSPPGRLQKCAYYHRFSDGYYFEVDPATLIGWNIHLFHTYEPEVRRQIKAALQPGATCFDVGANVGWHTLLMASLVGPRGRVVAFEPNASTRDRLIKGIAHNGFSQVLVRDEALSDQTDLGWFHAPHAGTLWDGTGRLVTTREATNDIVPCSTLDAFVKSRGIDRLDLIKIDVEGWELSVLRGSLCSIRRFQPRIIFEFDPAYVGRCGGTGSEIVDLLKSLNYELFVLDGRRRDPLAKLHQKAHNLLALPIGGD